jgi:hypothetical protein
MSHGTCIPCSMKKVIWDRLGIAFSSACVVHCLMVAFVPLFFPLIIEYTHSAWVHIVVLVTMLFTTPLAFVPGYKKHGLTWIMKTAIMGLLVVFLGILMEDKVSDQISHGISICGSLFIVFAHAKNLQHSHRHHHQCC